MIAQYAYQGDHEWLPEEDEVRQAFAEVVGAEEWPEPWADLSVRKLMADREEIATIRDSAKINGWDDILETCPPMPEVPGWLLYE